MCSHQLAAAWSSRLTLIRYSPVVGITWEEECLRIGVGLPDRRESHSQILAGKWSRQRSVIVGSQGNRHRLRALPTHCLDSQWPKTVPPRLDSDGGRRLDRGPLMFGKQVSERLHPAQAEAPRPHLHDPAELLNVAIG